MGPEQLAAEAVRLREAGDRESKAALGGHIARRYAAVRSCGALDWGQWLGAIKEVATWMPEASRRQIADDMARELVGDAAKARSLRSADVAKACVALGRLRRRGVGSDLARQWVNGSERYREASFDDLSALLFFLCGPPKELAEPCKEAAAKLAEHATRELFGKATSLKASSGREWFRFSIHLGPRLGAERQRAWCRGLRGTFAPGDAELLGLSGERFYWLASSLTALKDDGARAMVVRWVSASTAWQIDRPEILCWLGAQLKAAGQAGGAGHLRLLDHVERAKLDDPAKGLLVGLGHWQRLAGQAAGALPEARRRQWAAKLRGLFLDRPGGAACLKGGRDVAALAAALGALGEKSQTPALAVELVEKTASWRTWEAAGLGWLADRAADAGEKGKVARRRIAAHLTGARLSQPAAVRSAAPGQWASLAGKLGAELTAEQRSGWAEALTDAYAGSDEAVSALTVAQLGELVGALKRLADKDGASNLVKQVAQKPAVWRRWDAASQVKLLGLLGEAGESAESESKAIAENMAAAYGADTASFRSVETGVWRSFAGLAAKLLPAQRNAELARRLLTAYGESEGLASLKLGQLRNLDSAAKQLGGKGAASLTVAWASRAGALKPMSVGDLDWVLSNMGTGADAQAAALRKRAAEEVARKYLSDAKAARAVSFQTWGSLARHLRAALPAERREELIARLRAMHAGGAALGKKNVGEVRGLKGALDALGDPKSGEVVTAWASRPKALTSCGVGDLAWLGQALADRSDPAAAGVWRAIAEQVLGRLATGESLAKVAAHRDWEGLTAAAHRHMGEEQRSRWSSRLGEIATRRSASLTEMTPGGLLWLARAIDGEDAGANAARASIAQHLMDRFLSSASPPKGAFLWAPARWRAFANALAGGLPPEKRLEWASRLRATYLTNAAGYQAIRGRARGQFTDALRAIEQKAPRMLLPEAVLRDRRWKSWTPDALVGLSTELARAGDEARAHRLSVAEHVAARYLAKPGAARSIPVGAWQVFAQSLGKGLPPATRGQWAAALRGAFLADDALPKTRPEAGALVAALAALADERANDVAVAVVERSRAWRTWPPGDLAWLAGRLAACGAGSASAQHIVLAHITEACIGKADAAKTMGLGTWRSLVTTVGKQLTAAQRSRWAEVLLAARAGGQAQIAALGGADARDLCLVLEELGQRGKAVGLAVSVTGRTASWEKWPLRDQTAWLSLLAGYGEAASDSRRRVVERLAVRYILKPPAAEASDTALAASVVRAAEKHLTDSQKRTWSEALKSRFAPGSAALRALKASQVRGLCEALGWLGDPEAARPALAWAAQPTALASCGLSDLAWISGRLGQDKSAAVGDLRARIALQIERRFLTPEALAEAVGSRDWGRWTSELARQMRPAERARWTARLADIATGHPKSLDGLKPTGLLWLARSLSGKGANIVAARGSLAEHLVTHFLAESRAVEPKDIPSPGTWRQFAAVLAEGLPAPLRSRWIAALQRTFLGDPKRTEAMDTRAWGDLAGAMKALGAEGTDELAARFVLSGDGWKSWPASKLASLAGAVSGRGQAAKGARERIYEHIGSMHLADAAAVRAVSCADWHVLARRLAGDLTPEGKAAWAQKLGDAFLQDRRSLGRLAKGQVRSLTEAMSLLGSRQGGVVLIAWMRSRR